MPRVTFSLSNILHNRLLVIASEQKQSISQTIAELVHVGLYHLDEKEAPNPVETHCQQLIIQMNALMKRMAVETLQLTQEDFDELRKASIEKHCLLASRTF